MTVGDFLRDRLLRLILKIGTVTVLSLFLLLTGTASGVVALVLIIYLLVLLCGLGIDYRRTKGHLRELEDIMDKLDKKYLYWECIPKPKTAYEKKIYALGRRAGKSMIEEVSDARQQQRDYQEYIESWVHEIKAPITAAQLMCENRPGEFSHKLLSQLAQIEAHVERVLYYARAGSVEQDFVAQEAVLSEIVREAIEKQRALLIEQGVRIETVGLEKSVYTDGKWVAFMLRQMLSNAVRYRRKNPLILIESEQLGNLVRLTVTDNGIGIAEHDLPRIFDRGFTGENGRDRGGSTGMGLYICKKLADALEVDLRGESAPGSYTKIIMTFPARENLSKM